MSEIELLFFLRGDRFPLSSKPAFPIDKKLNANIRNLVSCLYLATPRKSVNVCNPNNVNGCSVNIRNVLVLYIIVFTTSTDNVCTGNAVNGPRKYPESWEAKQNC